MLINNGDGTYTGGPLDIWCILHNVEAGTYHAAFFEEDPMPGPIEPDFRKVKPVRLRSKMHHTTGADSLEGAQAHLDEMVAKVQVPEQNVWRDEPMPWDGEIGITFIADNWRVAA